MWLTDHLGQEGNAISRDPLRYIVGSCIVYQHMQRPLLLSVCVCKSSDTGRIIQPQLWTNLHNSFWKRIPA